MVSRLYKRVENTEYLELILTLVVVWYSFPIPRPCTWIPTPLCLATSSLHPSLAPRCVTVGLRDPPSPLFLAERLNVFNFTRRFANERGEERRAKTTKATVANDARVRDNFRRGLRLTRIRARVFKTLSLTLYYHSSALRPEETLSNRTNDCVHNKTSAN